MKVTEKGQVTVPKKLRRKYGITAATEVEFIERDGAIHLVKKAATGALGRFRGIADKKGIPRRTDEFLRLIREG
ncbi:MAG TPA: AbrB/MazE/SpoVT family DNA-binding domain-containing protein [Acidobacteriota bacterium]|jgi:AbrB family looped-hinge helix DNA binding protein|nr:AbrB/MazE/SpoVT family DNA-binding domain-containing protein [Acidobacteriota bacterium]